MICSFASKPRRTVFERSHKRSVSAVVFVGEQGNMQYELND